MMKNIFSLLLFSTLFLSNKSLAFNHHNNGLHKELSDLFTEMENDFPNKTFNSKKENGGLFYTRHDATKISTNKYGWVHVEDDGCSYHAGSIETKEALVNAINSYPAGTFSIALLNDSNGELHYVVKKGGIAKGFITIKGDNETAYFLLFKKMDDYQLK